jgi:NADH-ubiquinone oxidoreductase chain 1
LACTRLGVYTVMIAGLTSNSGYSLLGGLRALAQTISYDVRLAFIFVSFVVLISRYNLVYFYSFRCPISGRGHSSQRLDVDMYTSLVVVAKPGQRKRIVGFGM